MTRPHIAPAPPVRSEHSAGDRETPTIDQSLYSLIAVNVLTLVFALVESWELSELMVVYWGQSIIIGVASFFRILRLRKFSTDGFTINDQPVEPTEATKSRTAYFFLVHYGFFHVGYLTFLLNMPAGGQLFGWPFWVCIGAFGVNHAFSYRHHLALDARGSPNIGTLMFLPYARVLPMHLTIVFGVQIAGGIFGLLVFLALKTAADAIMHVVEHRVLRRKRG